MKFIFRKKLWEEDLRKDGCSEEYIKSFSWPDKIDGREVSVVCRLDYFVIMPKWCEIVEE